MTRVYVGIGSNVERERHVRDAVAALGADFGPLSLSGVYETRSVGFEGEPFFNLVAGFDTLLDLDAVVARLKAIERQAGRRRGEKRFGPRTLDIDVLVFGATCAREPVELPRAEILTEAYVLLPLAEVAPHERHPVLGESYGALQARLELDVQGMRRVALALPAMQAPAPPQETPP